MHYIDRSAINQDWIVTGFFWLTNHTIKVQVTPCTSNLLPQSVHTHTPTRHKHTDSCTKTISGNQARAWLKNGQFRNDLRVYHRCNQPLCLPSACCNTWQIWKACYCWFLSSLTYVTKYLACFPSQCTLCMHINIHVFAVIITYMV